MGRILAQFPAKQKSGATLATAETPGTEFSPQKATGGAAAGLVQIAFLLEALLFPSGKNEPDATFLAEQKLVAEYLHLLT